MGQPLLGGKTADRDPLAHVSERAGDEGRLASVAYLAWPFALYDRFVPREAASNWYRVHLHQARWFGGLTACCWLVALTWPLFASIWLANPTAIIGLYAVAMLFDIALFVVWISLGMRYSRRASRGEFFRLRWVPPAKGTPSQTP